MAKTIPIGLSSPGIRAVVKASDSVEADRLALLHLMNDAFAEAAGQVGAAVDRDYRIGQSIVRLRFAGTSLMPRITRAFAHLAYGGSTEPDLLIRIWDSRSTGRPLPLLVSSLIRLL